MKKQILNSSDEPIAKLPTVDTNKSYKIRNIILVVIVIAMIITGGTAVFMIMNHSSNAIHLKDSKNTKSNNKTKLDVKKKENSSKESEVSSSREEDVSKNSTDKMGDFNTLSQKSQLSMMIIWAMDRGNQLGSQELNDADTLKVDLNTVNKILIYPEPGNMALLITDNHDGTFSISENMDGNEEFTDTITGSELYDYSKGGHLDFNLDKIEFV